MDSILEISLGRISDTESSQSRGPRSSDRRPPRRVGFLSLDDLSRLRRVAAQTSAYRPLLMIECDAGAFLEARAVSGTRRDELSALLFG
jgi:hypothetical protein